MAANHANASLPPVLRVQALYYAVSGVWPILHMRSFEAVTGPKTDDWLVHMVGLLAVAVASALWPRRGDRPEVLARVRLLALAAAAAFLAIDVVYAFRGVISEIYLVDAVIEVGFLMSLARASAWRSPYT